MRLKTGHWSLLTLTLAVIVLLLLAPTKPEPGEDALSSDEMPAPPDTENRIDSALEIIASDAPMQGILLLRSIADEHPENFRAQYHMGRFSAQTGQWDKCIERMEQVQRIDPEFAEANYWLGLSYMQLGKAREAKKFLEEFLEKDRNNEDLRMEVQTMLNQIN